MQAIVGHTLTTDWLRACICCIFTVLLSSIKVFSRSLGRWPGHHPVVAFRRADTNKAHSLPSRTTRGAGCWYPNPSLIAELFFVAGVFFRRRKPHNKCAFPLAHGNLLERARVFTVRLKRRRRDADASGCNCFCCTFLCFVRHVLH